MNYEKMNENTEYQEKLMNAWRKVCAWCKENTNGAFPNGKRFATPHNPYVWISLVINDEGDAWLYRGTHSSNHPSYVLTEEGAYGLKCNNDICNDNHHKADFARNKTFDANIIDDELEMVLKMWPQLKQQIIKAAEWSNALNNFEA